MATDEILEMASLYTLGLLAPDVSQSFEQHIESGCPVCESEVRTFQETAAQVACSLSESAPPASLRAQLMHRISTPVAVKRANEGEWQPSPFPGVTVKRLFSDPVNGGVTSLIRMQPGSLYPSHRHFGLEHCYVLEGDLVFDDHTLQAGDYEVAAPRTDHPPTTTQHGCLLLVISNQQDRVPAQ